MASWAGVPETFGGGGGEGVACIMLSNACPFVCSAVVTHSREVVTPAQRGDTKIDNKQSKTRLACERLNPEQQLKDNQMNSPATVATPAV